MEGAPPEEVIAVVGKAFGFKEREVQSKRADGIQKGTGLWIYANVIAR
jgi:hypothetical protein